MVVGTIPLITNGLLEKAATPAGRAKTPEPRMFLIKLKVALVGELLLPWGNK